MTVLSPRSGSAPDVLRGSGDGAKVQAEQQPAPLLLYEDERRAELVLDLMPYLPVFGHRTDRFPADYHSGVSVHPDCYLIPFEGFVGEMSGVVPGEPLLFTQHEAAWSYSDEVVCENTTERDRIPPQLGCSPVLSQPLLLPALLLHQNLLWSSFTFLQRSVWTHFRGR